ncbi:hypothetical protein HNQ80_002994 [Anaerosolibacter carboniphilus]|uniref:Putative amidase domain-containing protein n=1 Tax=Anaerosolibacter carboniphilus TaxID=1417629 RepID=A0A841L3C2_9FIRM|nr:amidase domain-containing protein [Anaerosolibacter carboniphilus]MBB6216889.1 hypothetical protein [Anaerosolibacter carboniphilus]
MKLLIQTRKSMRNMMLLCICAGIIISSLYMRDSVITVSTARVDEEFAPIVKAIFDTRNRAIMEQDTSLLDTMYDKGRRNGLWAYEHELKKMKYLHRWSEKQGIRFTKINANTMVKWVKKKDEGYTINLVTSTEYQYSYENDVEKNNLFRIGTYHSMDIRKLDETWVITREWYTDPFADSLQLDMEKSAEFKEYIQAQPSRDFADMGERRNNAVAYADAYCGAAGDEESGYSYNKKYKNYNPLGGDCANFASQILHEGGKFRKNGTWNYDGDGSKAWVNAQAFKNYMLYSGRASKIAYGSYEKVYKQAYQLLPGDFVAYEKNGKVTHISVVTGVDAKGYALVNCHNTDRYRVPWDLGWSNKGIKFWLVRVHF